MFLASASTKRPIAMSCLIIALVILGFNSYRKLSIENLPSVDVPYITITTTWLGASPEDMEKDVAKYIEDAVSGVEGLKHVNSLCMENVCSVMIEFDLSVDVDVASQNVREKIDGVLSNLPAAADRPVIEKLDINATGVATMFLKGTYTRDDLYEFADNNLSDRFATVNGVAEVQLTGGNEREVWVELDRNKLAAAGLTSSQVVSAIQSGILTMPGGRIREHGSEYSLRFDAEYNSIEEIASMEVVAKDGSRRYLSDLGSVRKATEEVRQRATLNGEPGVIIKVVKKSDGNTVQVVNDLKKRFEELKQTLPQGMELVWVFDDGEIVQSTVDSTIDDIVSAVILCAVILFVFLINVRTTLIVSITMPVTMIISLFFIYACGLSLNVSTMLAIGLSTGILVSNSIVVLENVVKRFDTIEDKWEAAYKGTSEVAVAVLASAGTNVVVMLPIAMMSSIVGRFFTPFAIATLIVNAASIFISFTLTPILCALFMKKRTEMKGRLGRLSVVWEEKFTALGNKTSKLLASICRSTIISFLVLGATVALFFLTMKYGTHGLGFTMIENDDWGRIFVRLECPSYYDLERTTVKAEEAISRIKDLPDLNYTVMTVGKADAMGGQANEGVYLAQIELIFKSVYERDWKITDVIVEVRKRLAEITDVVATVSIPATTGGTQNTLDLNISGPELEQLSLRAQKLQQLGMHNPGVGQIDTTARDDKPELLVTPKRAVLNDIGFTAQGLGILLRGNVDGIEAASYKAGEKTIDIRVKLAEEEGASQVDAFAIPGYTGYPVPLSTVAQVDRSSAKILIYRVDKERTVKVVGAETPGYASGTVIKELQNTAEENGLVGTDGYYIRPSGQAEMIDESVADFGEAILLAILMTYLTLSAILESFVRPFIVLLTIPMSLIGVILALQISGMNISIFVLLGIVLLIGVVVNAAVLIVDRMGQLIAQGMDKRTAMLQAVEDTFRSVVMVVAASGLGMVPIAMASGIGAVNRIGIGAASVGGIIVAGILTIIVLPVLYVRCTKKQTK